MPERICWKHRHKLDTSGLGFLDKRKSEPVEFKGLHWFPRVGGTVFVLGVFGKRNIHFQSKPKQQKKIMWKCSGFGFSCLKVLNSFEADYVSSAVLATVAASPTIWRTSSLHSASWDSGPEGELEWSTRPGQSRCLLPWCYLKGVELFLFSLSRTQTLPTLESSGSFPSWWDSDTFVF